MTADDGMGLLERASEPNSISFVVLPKDLRNGVAKEIQVLNSERIIGYSTYSGMLRNDKGEVGQQQQSDHDHSLLLTNDDSDYYNVTVNLIVKKGGASNPSDFAAATPTQQQQPPQQST